MEEPHTSQSKMLGGNFITVLGLSTDVSAQGETSVASQPAIHPTCWYTIPQAEEHPPKLFQPGPLWLPTRHGGWHCVSEGSFRVLFEESQWAPRNQPTSLNQKGNFLYLPGNSPEAKFTKRNEMQTNLCCYLLGRHAQCDLTQLVSSGCCWSLKL